MGYVNYLRPADLEGTKRQLQRRLGRPEKRGSRKSRPRSLFLPGRLECGELIEGMVVGLHVQEGAWVGSVAAVHQRAVTIFPWGGGPLMTLARDEIAFALIVGPHGQSLRGELGRRQREGRPGVVRSEPRHQANSAT